MREECAAALAANASLGSHVAAAVARAREGGEAAEGSGGPAGGAGEAAEREELRAVVASMTRECAAAQPRWRSTGLPPARTLLASMIAVIRSRCTLSDEMTNSGLN